MSCLQTTFTEGKFFIDENEMCNFNHINILSPLLHNDTFITYDSKPNPTGIACATPCKGNNVRGISIAFLNICSVLPKCSDIMHLINELDVDIFLFNETWLHEKVPNGFISFPGFRIHRIDRTPKVGGGIFRKSPQPRPHHRLTKTF